MQRRRRKEAAKRGTGRDGLGTRIDVTRSGRGHRRGPRRHEAPAVHLERSTVVALDDDRDRLSRRDVVARAQLVQRQASDSRSSASKISARSGRVGPHRHPSAHGRDTRTVNTDYPALLAARPGHHVPQPRRVRRVPVARARNSQSRVARAHGAPADPLPRHGPRGPSRPRSRRARRVCRRDPDDLAFVPNATTGVNTVLHSLDFEAGRRDPDHRPRIQRDASTPMRFVAEQGGARRSSSRTIALPIEAPAEVASTRSSRASPPGRGLPLISHVTSPTGLVFPIERDRRALDRTRHRHPRRRRACARAWCRSTRRAQRGVLHGQRAQVAVHAEGQRLPACPARPAAQSGRW